MCQFCVQHGDGQKWYLAMKNYSRELLEQEHRLEYMAEFANTFVERIPTDLAQLEALSRSPFHSLAQPYLRWQQKREHYGQVVPIEEIEQILKQVDGIARLPCVCRRLTTGQKQARYCFALTAHPRLAEMLDDSFSLEYLNPEEAIAAVRDLDEQGLIHTVWTFKTPYIGGLCNCDQDCIAYRICHTRKYFQVMFRAEYIARVIADACNGCKNCMRQCQFGAVRFSAANQKVEIDPRQCYGCGVCRASCKHEAITLVPRPSEPVAANVW